MLKVQPNQERVFQLETSCCIWLQTNLSMPQLWFCQQKTAHCIFILFYFIFFVISSNPLQDIAECKKKILISSKQYQAIVLTKYFLLRNICTTQLASITYREEKKCFTNCAAVDLSTHQNASFTLVFLIVLLVAILILKKWGIFCNALYYWDILKNKDVHDFWVFCGLFPLPDN